MAEAAADCSFQSPLLSPLLDNCSVCTAKLHAVYLVLKLICHSRRQSFLMLSDSPSVLASINSSKYDQSLSMDISNSSSNGNKVIVFAWVPVQVGIMGNTVVDLAAKLVLKNTVSKRLVL